MIVQKGGNRQYYSAKRIARKHELVHGHVYTVYRCDIPDCRAGGCMSRRGYDISRVAASR
jgi:hypothetical protein